MKESSRQQITQINGNVIGRMETKSPKSLQQGVDDNESHDAKHHFLYIRL